MTMLTDFNHELAAHFASLSAVRNQRGHPTYAIEHPLDVDRVTSMKDMLVEALAGARAASEEHWLSWIVLGAEIGYEFDGEEYWETFAERVPGWRDYGNRRQVRRWFKAFAREFGGYEPQGRWATHFSIIAWPIAHAILPLDLQAHFARLIFDLRYELAATTGADASALGDRLRSARHGYTRSSRFDALLEQTDLTGRILLGLRDQDVKDETPRLLPVTLSRIVSDLEGTRHAREWLNETRRVLRDARSRASARLRVTNRDATRRTSEDQSSRCAIIAHPTSTGGWQVCLSLPDFGATLRSRNIDSTVLNDIDLTILDEATVRPGRSLLGLSATERPIQGLATLSRPALNVSPPTSPLAPILQELGRVRGTSPWLLRLQSDGTARQVVGNHVRSEQTYLLISATALPENALKAVDAHQQQTSLLDAFGYLFVGPTQIAPHLNQALSELGLGRIFQTVIEPVGLVPRKLGSDSATTWLATEEPLLSVRSNDPQSSFFISVDAETPISVPAVEQGIVVTLGHLELGTHRVVITTTHGFGTGLSETEEVVLEVRAPRPWSESNDRALGFRAIIEPEANSIEDIVEGRSNTLVIGPPGRRATIRAETYRSTGERVNELDLGNLVLPATPEQFRQRLAKLAEEPFSSEVQQYPRTDLVFGFEELGRRTFSFFRKVEPLRWSLEKDRSGWLVRLIDELGSDAELHIERYDITRPEAKVPLSLDQCLAGMSVESPGALFLARAGKRAYRTIVSVPPRTLMSLADLGVAIRINSAGLTLKGVPRLLGLLRLWNCQHLRGQLAAHRKRKVIAALEYALVEALCGTAWRRKYEQAVNDASDDLTRLQRELGGSPGFGHRMRTTNFLRPVENGAPLAAFTRWSINYEITDNADLAAFAFKLAFDATALRFDDPHEGAHWVNLLADVPTLCRGAFLARLASIRASAAQQEAA